MVRQPHLAAEIGTDGLAIAARQVPDIVLVQVLYQFLVSRVHRRPPFTRISRFRRTAGRCVRHIASLNTKLFCRSHHRLPSEDQTPQEISKSPHHRILPGFYPFSTPPRS